MPRRSAVRRQPNTRGWVYRPSLFQPRLFLSSLVLEQKVQMVYDQMPPALLVTVAISVCIATRLSGSYGRGAVLLWLAFTVVLAVLRFLDLRAHNQRLPEAGEAARGQRNLILGAAAQGLLFGITGMALLPSAVIDQMFLLVVLCGICGGAIISLSALWPAYLVFLVCTLAPPSFRFIATGAAPYALLGWIGLFYTLAMAFGSNATSQWVEHSLLVARDRERLSDQIRSANEDLEIHREHLEKLVQDRTRELRLSNEQLQQEMVAREKEHEKATKSEHSYRLLFESMGEGFGQVDPDEIFTLANPAAERIFGTPPGTLAGRSLTEFLDAADSEMVRRETTLRIRGLSSTYTHEIRRADGEHRWLQVKSFPIMDSEGTFIGASAVFRDITELRLAEEALRKSERRNQAILEAMPDDIFLNTRDGRFLGLQVHNPNDLALPPESFLASTVQEIFPLELAIRFMTAFEAAILTGQTQIFTYESPGSGGIQRWEARVVKCEEDSVVTLLRNITDQWCTEQRLRQSQKLESLGVLAGGVAHDMNNVLGAILGLASAHLEIQPPESSAHHAFETVFKAALRGGKMVKSLLGFARQSPAEERELDLNALLREQRSLLERTTLSKVSMVTELDPGLHLVRGDASALAHAVMNLSINAVDAMGDSGTLTLRTRNVDGAWVEVLVEDTGTGMPKEVLEKAMDPFFTTKEEGKGTGLGLYMVYSTVKAHRGQIEIQSEPDRGTCVRMRFPACAETVHAKAAEGRVEPLPGQGRRALNVLVVDDDELVRNSTQTLLDVLGHETTLTTSGEEALRKLESGFRPDVVMLDMNMPGLNGAATLRRIRGMLPRVPVLLATGRADQTALDLVEAYTSVTLLPKPFSLGDLQSRLAGL